MVDQAAVATGRDPADIATIYNVFGTITDAPVDVARRAGSNGVPVLRGTVEQWTGELVAAINDYGAGGFVFFSVADSAEEQEAARFRWAHEIVPAVRAATGAE